MIQDDQLNSLSVFYIIDCYWVPIYAGHVACVGEGRGVYRVRWGKLRKRDHCGDPDVNVRIILRWIFRKRDVGV
jgi:hypothetical protein